MESLAGLWKKSGMITDVNVGMIASKVAVNILLCEWYRGVWPKKREEKGEGVLYEVFKKGEKSNAIRLEKVPRGENVGMKSLSWEKFT